MNLSRLRTLGGKGDADTEFRVRLAGIAVDSADRLYAIGDQEVKVFSPEGLLLRRFDTGDAGWVIATDGDDLWIGMQGSLVRFDSAGNRLSQIDDPRRLGLITGLAVVDGQLIAADATNRSIHVYKENGQWVRDIGADVNTRGFMLPNGVLDLAFDSSGKSLVVAHPQKHRVEQYDIDGTLINKFGRFGMTDPADFGGCCNPTNIAVTPDGKIVVSEKAPPRVKIFTPEGEFLAQSPVDVFSSNTKNIDLAVDSQHRLYATDPLLCRIQVFQIVNEEVSVP